MPDDHGALDFELTDPGEIAGECVHRVALLGGVALAVAAQVDGHDEVAASEVLDVRRPEPMVASDPVHEYERRIAGTMTFDRERNPIAEEPFHAGSEKLERDGLDAGKSGACRSEQLIAGEHVPDGLGELAGEVDLRDPWSRAGGRGGA